MSVGSPEFLIEAEAAAEAGIEPAGDQIAARSPLGLFWRRIRADRVAVAAAGVIVFLILGAILAPVIIDIVGAPGPNGADKAAHDQFGNPTGPKVSGLWPFIVAPVGLVLALISRSLPWQRPRRYAWLVIGGSALLGSLVLAIVYWPSTPHLFGVDKEYRDVFSRVLYGARVSLEVAVIATGVSMLIGVTMGMLAGYFRGWIDMAISRFVDLLLAFPILLLALGLAAACKLGQGCLGGLIQPGLTVVIAVIALVNWTYIARIVRGQVLSLREKEFIDAARSLGASNLRIIFREILPNLVAPIIVYTSLIIPQNVLFESALSYLGVGVQFPQASWGAMLADGSDVFSTAWWYMVFPGVALLLTVLAFNLLGDGLQDALNPRANRT
jgi:ABC-type dipeptide/oligopeptide/nickel transport system permease subunit